MLRQAFPHSSTQQARSSVSEHSFQLHHREHPDRARVEALIAANFKKTYGAQITEFSPLLLSFSQTQALQAVVGLRTAQHEPLFLEQYLSSPIEQTLATLLKRPIHRRSIIEIGNLSASQGSSLELFIVMTAALANAQFHLMVFTATTQVKKLISRLNCETHFIEKAEAQRLGDRALAWGNYYQSEPEISLVNSQDALHEFLRNPFTNKVLQKNSSNILTLSKALQTC